MKSPELYFDHAASTPPLDVALQSYLDTCRQFYANPSSTHHLGVEASKKLSELKETFCETLNFYDGQLIHTSSASEANNLVVHSFFKEHPDGKIILGADCHASLSFVKKKYPLKVQVIPLNVSGAYKLDALKLNSQDNYLVLLNLVSQEIGTLHDPNQLGYFFLNKNFTLHFDAAQAVGKTQLKLDQIHFHSITFSSHKFGGCRGSGILLIKDRPLHAQCFGGQQESGYRAGTENISALASATTALVTTISIFDQYHRQLTDLDHHLYQSLKKIKQKTIIHSPSSKAPGINSLAFLGYSGQEIVKALSLKGVCVSTGSACADDEPKPSETLLGLGISAQQALSSIRISFSNQNSRSEIELFISLLQQTLNELNLTHG